MDSRIVSRRVAPLVAAAIACAAGIGIAAQLSPRLSAQQDRAWFGLTLPAGMGDVHQPVVTVAAAMPPAIVPPGEEENVDLSGAAIRRDVEAIVAFSKQSRTEGNRVWGRVSGFPSAAATAEWTAAQFRAAGLQDVQVQRYTGSAPMWWATGWEARLIGSDRFGPGTRDVVLESALPASGSQIGNEPVVAPLVYAGMVRSEEPIAADVKGKVAVQHMQPAGGAYSERTATVARARDLFSRGAVGVINVVEQTGNMHVRDFGNCGGPCFNVGAEDGAFLRGAMERAAQANLASELRIRLSLEAESLTGLTAQNVVGRVPGASDEIVIVNAHLDGWFDAAGDNGDGLAVLVALARHFARPRNRPARTIVFVASGGHHSTGLNGPGHFVEMNPAITQKTKLVLNLEHVAQMAIRRDPWRVESTEQPMSFGISNQAPFLVATGQEGRTRYGFNLNPTFTGSVPGDLGGYGPLGVARVQAIHSGPMYHTSGDVLETISVPGLERAARFFAFFVTKVTQARAEELNPGLPGR